MQCTVAERATFESHVDVEPGVRHAEGPELLANVRARQVKRVGSPSGELAVPGQEDPAVPPESLQDLIVRHAASVFGIVSQEPEVTSQTPDHLVREPPGFDHPLPSREGR